MNKIILVVSFLMFFINSTYSATYSLEELMHKIYRNNNDIKVKRIEVEKAQAQTRQAKSAFIPDFTASGTYAEFDNKTGLGREDGDSLVFKMVQPLYTGGSLPAGVRIAANSYRMSGENLEKTIQDSLYNGISLYFNILKLEKTIGTLEESILAVKEHKKNVNSHYNAGTAMKNDLLRVEVEQAKLEYSLLNTRAGLAKYRNNLDFLTGNTLGSDFVLNETEYTQKEWENDKSLYDIAVENREDVKVFRRLLDIQKDHVKIAQAEKLPQIGMSCTYTDGDNIVQFPESWQAGVMVEYNLFDGGYVDGVILEKKKDLNAAQIQYMQLLESIRIECINTELDYRTSMKNIEVSEKMVRHAQETLRLTESQYNTGVVSSVTVLDDRVKLTDAQTNYYSAMYDYKVALAGMYYVSGQLRKASDILGVDLNKLK